MMVRLIRGTVALALAPVLAAADRPRQESALADSSLEDLMNVEVTSVSRKKQPLSKSAAAVYVITQSDIQRSGATSIPEALRLAPGLMVARLDSNKWAIGARGTTGRLANKTLVLIDGRSVYTNIYSGVYWDQNDTLLEDIERIEVIRGPGGTMWGANAVTAVINIITKSTRHTQGLLATAGGGNYERGFGSVRYGGSKGDNLHYRAYSKFFNRGELRNDKGMPAGDDWNSLRGGARLDWDPTLRDSISIHGDLYRERAGESVMPNYSFVPNSAWVGSQINGHGGYAQFRWERTLSDTSDMAFQTYFNHEGREEGMGDAETSNWDFDFQHHRTLGERNDLLWGVSYRLYADNVRACDLTSYSVIQPEQSSSSLYSAFAQNDFSLVPNRLTLTAGAKLLHNRYTGFEIQPSVRLLWTPNARQSLWTSVSRAVRTPSRKDLDVYILFSIPRQMIPFVPAGAQGVLLGDPNFRSEVLHAYEGGWRWQAGSRVTVDVAVFVNSLLGLQSISPFVRPPAGLPRQVILAARLQNSLNQRSGGVEAATTYRLRRNLRAHANYTWFRPGEAETIAGMGINPYAIDRAFRTHQAQTGLSWDVARGKLFDLNVYAYSGLARQPVKPEVRADARFAIRTGERTEWSVGIQDMFADQRTEYTLDEYVKSSNVTRSVYMKVTWGR